MRGVASLRTIGENEALAQDLRRKDRIEVAGPNSSHRLWMRGLIGCRAGEHDRDFFALPAVGTDAPRLHGGSVYIRGRGTVALRCRSYLRQALPLIDQHRRVPASSRSGATR